MKNPELTTQGAGNSKAAVKGSLADELCPIAPTYRSWYGTNGGLYPWEPL